MRYWDNVAQQSNYENEMFKRTDAQDNNKTRIVNKNLSFALPNSSISSETFIDKSTSDRFIVTNKTETENSLVHN